jgi:hypothetical protein
MAQESVSGVQVGVRLKTYFWFCYPTRLGHVLPKSRRSHRRRRFGAPRGQKWPRPGPSARGHVDCVDQDRWPARPSPALALVAGSPSPGRRRASAHAGDGPMARSAIIAIIKSSRIQSARQSSSRSHGGCHRARRGQGAVWKRRREPPRSACRPTLTASARGGQRTCGRGEGRPAARSNKGRSQHQRSSTVAGDD